MKKFDKQDIVRNYLKTHPRVRFFCYNGKIYYNNSIETSVMMNDFLIREVDGEDIPAVIDNAVTLEDGTFLLNEDGTYLMLEE